RRFRELSAGNDDAESAQDLLGLVLVDLHAASASRAGEPLVHRDGPPRKRRLVGTILWQGARLCRSRTPRRRCRSYARNACFRSPTPRAFGPWWAKYSGRCTAAGGGIRRAARSTRSRASS